MPTNSGAVPAAPLDRQRLRASLALPADAEDPGPRPLRELPLTLTQAECPLPLRVIQEVLPDLQGQAHGEEEVPLQVTRGNLREGDQQQPQEEPVQVSGATL